MAMNEEQNQTLRKKAGCAKINTFGMIFLKKMGDSIMCIAETFVGEEVTKKM